MMDGYTLKEHMDLFSFDESDCERRKFGAGFVFNLLEMISYVGIAIPIYLLPDFLFRPVSWLFDRFEWIINSMKCLILYGRFNDPSVKESNEDVDKFVDNIVALTVEIMLLNIFLGKEDVKE